MDIKEMREFTGQTQKDFAESLGIPLGTVRRWEYGESTPAPYVLRMIAEKLPVNTASMEKLESPRGTFYYDRITGMMADSRGTRIAVGVDINEVNRNNLIIYADELFGAYYDAVEKFKRDCMLDKEEKIIWE